MGRVYVARIVGDGTPTNHFRVRARDIPGFRRVRALGIPTGSTGQPLASYAICEVEADDFAAFDADTDLLTFADRLDLDAVPTAGRRNQINNFLSRFGATTRAAAGETYRVIGNNLLTELGSSERL